MPDIVTPDIRIVEPATPEDFSRYYALRWKVLRAPWGQPRGSEKDPLENDSTHLMAVDRHHCLLGVSRLHFNSIGQAQIRYMAVDIDHQRQGIGRLLLTALEHRAACLGATSIVLNARETALGFYRKHAYVLTGPGPMLYNRIAHIRLEKILKP